MAKVAWPWPENCIVQEIYYLIDSQASHSLLVLIQGAAETYQPIRVGEKNETKLKLSREQALAVAQALQEAALRLPAVEPGIEYPGKII